MEIVATRYIDADFEQICAYVPMRCSVLGTDGYGRSDTRENLRPRRETPKAETP